MNENNTLEENVKENNSNTNIEKLSKTEKNKKVKAKFLLIGFLVIIAIAIGLYVGYKKLNNDPMSIYKDSINSVYKTLNNALKENKNNSMDNLDITKDPIVLNLDAKIDSSIPELKSFTGLNYSVEAGLDYANRKMNLGLGIQDSNSSILSFILSVIDQNIYLKSEELYNKVLDLGEEDIFGNLDFSSYFTVNGNEATFDYDNYSYILKEFKTIIIDSLDKNKFSMDNELINIRNFEYKAKKATYSLDKENMERTLNFIKDRILKDDKLLEAIAKSTGTSIDDLKEALSEEIDMSGYTDIKINLYTDKLNNLIAGTIVIDEEEIIKFDCIKDEFNFGINYDGVTLKTNKDKEEKISFIASENDIEIIKITIDEIDKENVRIDYNINADGVAISGNILIKDYKVTKDSISFGMKIVLESPVDFTIDGNFKIEKREVKTLDSTGSISIDNISEEEAMEIFTKLGEILERFGLSDIVDSFM